ncbi:uncharacterized protein L969DRAFT_89838 [Mixia osmundae IAM 14324]|uniref:Uncharacterized protein n=1 Tax=Mixia osmundae (strain CBS 9802 / IAM 14324 / JCM 22182 / KY 12970) TaxID=764103 RepID=G7DWE4_MIXOS|nr:uncharacterized protein L969DRAFT_89838 [Mixia osmundae IAM 14324]KEI37283.1 hypothetical protein L969DRAFT_89838 [Mixia osmundae IAM 14324]GAA94904.1 hypothetical protein E5Q_01559 [Mixia osmundae IAM 14324]
MARVVPTDDDLTRLQRLSQKISSRTLPVELLGACWPGYDYSPVLTASRPVPPRPPSPVESFESRDTWHRAEDGLRPLPRRQVPPPPPAPLPARPITTTIVPIMSINPYRTETFSTPSFLSRPEIIEITPGVEDGEIDDGEPFDDGEPIDETPLTSRTPSRSPELQIIEPTTDDRPNKHASPLVHPSRLKSVEASPTDSQNPAATDNPHPRTLIEPPPAFPSSEVIYLDDLDGDELDGEEVVELDDSLELIEQSARGDMASAEPDHANRGTVHDPTYVATRALPSPATMSSVGARTPTDDVSQPQMTLAAKPHHEADLIQRLSPRSPPKKRRQTSTLSQSGSDDEPVALEPVPMTISHDGLKTPEPQHEPQLPTPADSHHENELISRIAPISPPRKRRRTDLTSDSDGEPQSEKVERKSRKPETTAKGTHAHEHPIDVPRSSPTSPAKSRSLASSAGTLISRIFGGSQGQTGASSPPQNEARDAA